MKASYIDFEINLFSLNQLPHFYTQIFDDLTDSVLFENKNEKALPVKLDNNILVVKDIPTFFDLTIRKENKITFKKIRQYPGYLMNFESFLSAEHYLKSRFGSSSRYKLRREKKRLEYCFDIKYHMYFGEITKEEYDYLMDYLYRFLRARSREKGIMNNINLESKDFYKEKILPMILQRKASLYVIFNGNTPIDICINFHVNDIIYQYIRTYDIAYSKFKTGYTNLMKQIEWLIANEKKVIIFSSGNPEWKEKWCNSKYDYYYHYWYKKNSFQSKALVSLELAKRRLRQFMVDKKLIDLYHSLVRRKHSSTEAKTFEPGPILSNSEHCFDEEKKVFALNEESHYEIKRKLNDFLYSAHEKEKDVTIYEYIETKNTFLFKGKEKSMNLSLL
nr:GNAT family N-acetyltransferase [uncultured Allomuricauda sp.]